MASAGCGWRLRPHTPKPEVESRTLGSRPRTDTLEAKDRNVRGQGHKRKCSPKKKKRSSQKFFKRSPRKHVFQKIFQALHKILTIQKLVLSSSRGQANFRGQGLQNVSSRPRTSSRTPPLPKAQPSHCKFLALHLAGSQY